MQFSRYAALNTICKTGVVYAILLATPFILALPGRSQAASPRDLVQSGVDAYIKSGPSAAFSAWTKGGVTEGNNQMRLQFEALKQLDAAYGALEGSDVILDLNVGTRVRFVYFVLYYGKGTAYGYVEAFRLRPGGWVMAGLNINTKPQEIIPEALLPRIPVAQ